MHGHILEVSFTDPKGRFVCRAVKSLIHKKGVPELVPTRPFSQFPFTNIKPCAARSVLNRYKDEGLFSHYKLKVIKASDVFKENITNYSFLIPLGHTVSMAEFKRLVFETYAVHITRIRVFYECLDWINITHLKRKHDGALISYSQMTGEFND